MTARSTAQSNATTVRDETTAGANTATRVGTALKQIADNVVFTDDTSLPAHATQHKSGGSDPIKLNELAAPTAAVAGNAQEATGWADPTASTSLATRNYVDFLGAISFWGDGSDGALTSASGTTTLTRDMFYTNVTLSGTAVLDCAGFRVFINGTLDISAAQAGAITRKGGNGGAGAATTTGGTAGTACTNNNANGTTVLGGGVASAGGAGGTAAGVQAAAGSVVTFGIGGDSGAGGVGGTGSGGAGGALRAGTVIGQRQVCRRAIMAATFGTSSGTGSAITHFAGAPAPGGSGGGGDGTAGGGGGGGGASGGGIEIYARTLVHGGSTPAACITAVGGNGGNGGTPGAGNRGGGGGGAGAGGGFIHLVVGFLSGAGSSNALDASGGTGGTGGNGTGTGTGGHGGDGGNAGHVGLYVVSTGAVSTAGNNTAGTAGSAASGTTGGAGGAGSPARVSL